MKLTEPQRRLLGYCVDEWNRWQHSVSVSGSQLRTAEALKRKGLVEVGVGGTGVAYKAPWWHQITPTEQGIKEMS